MLYVLVGDPLGLRVGDADQLSVALPVTDPVADSDGVADSETLNVSDTAPVPLPLPERDALRLTVRDPDTDAPQVHVPVHEHVPDRTAVPLSDVVALMEAVEDREPDAEALTVPKALPLSVRDRDALELGLSDAVPLWTGDALLVPVTLRLVDSDPDPEGD